MSNDTRALRRQVLLARCAQQRHDCAQHINGLLTPISSAGGGGLASFIGGNLKLPLTIAGVVLGMVVAKPARALPLLATGFSLFKMARSGLAMLSRKVG
jgi:hypothetical protein